MSQDAIRAQIEAMPEDRKKELAEYMLLVYQRESNEGWVDDSRYDLLDAPQWEPPADCQRAGVAVMPFRWNNTKGSTRCASGPEAGST